ncbi:MAG: Flp pilus assembly complex ATPase component TadA [Nannocystaceae bacterium]|nr:Flp pilus assembly complex ATPase component TadA [Nannocystaceae bacterium]
MADGPLPNLLAGDPDEVLIAGTSRVRISRGGHVSEGASPFTCEAAISCWVDRVCSAPGGDAKFPLKGAFGAYSVRAVGGASGMVVSLRRASSQGPATLESLVRGGVLSHGIATLLSACVVSRLNVLVCAGPGSNAEALLAALMACAPPTELQVVLGNAQLDAGLFQGTVVLLRRDDFGRDAIGSALSLGPDRIGVDELRWDEAAAITGVVSRSMSYILGVRANTAPLGVGLLESMLTKSAPPQVARQLLMGSVDVVLTAQLFADAVTRVTALSEPTLDDAGVLSAQDIFALVPGTRTWKYSGVTPRCFEDITRRGFPLDSSVFT